MSRSFCIAAVGLSCVATAARAGIPLGPDPIGMSTITVSYQTTSGPVSFSGARDYSGVGPGDATNLGSAPNIRAFNSVNTFGRRTIVPGALGVEESLMAHAFFKIDNDQDYFPDLVPDGDITVTIEGIEFAAPAALDPSTVMLHVKWLPDQADQLSSPYIQVDDHHTQTDPFRDFDDFLNFGAFSDFPVPNYVLEDIDVQITPIGPQSFSLTITFPYEQLKNLEETGQPVPPGLPAPQGFLEPFHFHLEYVVSAAGDVPAASTWGLAALCGLLLAAGGLLIARRRQSIVI